MKNVFIVNKASRTGKAADTWARIDEYLKNNKVEYQIFFTAGAGDATEFARQATSSGEKVGLFVMGGDGTLNEALNGIADFENTLYTPLPSGSANDFVSGIGLQGDAVDILDRALNTEEYKTYDIGKVIYEGGERLFGVSSGIGVDAYVCLQALTSRLKKFLNRFGLGAATYGLLTVGDIFTMPFIDGEITTWFKDEKREFYFNGTIFAAAMNCKAEGGGIPMAPNARPDSGYLTAFCAHDISRLKCLCLLPFLIAGKHEGKPGFNLLNFDKIHIKLKSPMCLHVDGEHVGFFEEIRFECLPHALKIRG
ncbi:diacylglycerol/lipid kinase family protein [Pseudobutyrivibrio xylanivorans]|uniref:Diacylglycerol kinase family enzyme n=1 Tax=Pseudobutyrivibrio xylanivorans DSM 14809 TaxID=1123012 RepID=A0A1M6CCA9_PSEXY|nr:diacylglycerol kinase family protein [Pseudobutyrivibrio xylanivorans]SHI58424.1 Diacylglycerol kinase family enzyme [Pseudobutyrivibrio xylanivorans DSM 14809]